MLDLNYVINNFDAVVENNKKRGFGDTDISFLPGLAEKRVSLIQETDNIRSEIKQSSKQKGGDVEHIREIKEQLKAKEQELEEIQKKIDDTLLSLPNLTDPEVPVGTVEDNLVVRQEGERPNFGFKVRSHVEIGEKLGILDLERGSKLAGSGYYYLKNELVQIRMAIVQMFMKHLMEGGFQVLMTPVVAKERVFWGTGYFPFATKDNYKITDENLFLIGTSEQSLVAQHMDEMLQESELPLCYTADTACFRTEAGSYGRDTKGMIRVHQFHKVEQIIICKPEESEKYQKVALDNEEWLLKQLKIPYQVVLISTGDMGAPGYKKYDIEGWLPSQNRYMELTSNTNLTDFQARRLNIRVKGEKKYYPHTISATGFSDRLLVAIIENYQQEDGSLRVPEVLVPFVGKEVIK